MTRTKTFPAVIIGVFAALLVLILFGSHSVSAGAPPGLHATVATSSSPTLGATSATVIVSTSTCMARIVSTGGSIVMLSFNDAQTPTGSFGVQQAASTTVAYDAAQYGCGQMKAFSFAASIITVIDTR